jgi:phosphoglucomutase
VRKRRARAGLVFTASHNPPEYQGLKLLDASGASLSADVVKRIERAVGPERPEAAPAPVTAADDVDLATPYGKDLLAVIERAAIARARPRVVYDAMHGAGAPVLSQALSRLGARVVLLRGEPDPRFGGGAPDPVPARLQGLARSVRATRGVRLGLATDGDADRFAVLDRDGRVLTDCEAAALLVDHLARSGRIARGLALSHAVGSLVEKVAAGHGLAVTRHPVGFRNLSHALVSGAADAAVDECGGFALARLGFEKDGMLGACLMTELAVSSRTSLRARLAAELAGSAVTEAIHEDGLRLVLADGFAWLRASGTEPVLRIYAEAATPRALASRLAAAARLLQAGGERSD